MSPTPPPPGVFPIFLRGVTCENYGLKTGEGVMDLVDYKLLAKSDIVNEVAKLGVMSDFEPAKKMMDSYQGTEILLVVDKAQTYGEVFLLCLTEEAKENYMATLREQEEAIEAQRRAEEEAEEAKRAAEYARLNAVYEDRPISPRQWESSTSNDTENEVKLLSHKPGRERIVLEILRPKSYTNQSYKFLDRDADVSGVQEFRSHKDPHFVSIKEKDIGLQAAPFCVDNSAQTTWNRPVNKAVQYTPRVLTDASTVMEGDGKEELFTSLENTTVRVEKSLQQNETMDIFNETFKVADDEELHDGMQTENELRELKNFADPTYSKSKILSAIDWLPKAQGMVACSAVKNMSLDQRIAVSGQTSVSHILLWDFRQLVRPQILMQCSQEILQFRFNATAPHIVAGGCSSGQVVLWDISDALNAAARKGTRNANSGGEGAEEEEAQYAPVVSPKYMSNVDYGHRKAVSDLFWLPPTIQFNYRGQIVAPEHLDGNVHQFITVSGDGQVLVWDTRFEQIANDELRHIGRQKHIYFEKFSTKEGGMKPQWTPIFRAHLKRTEGVGELSICRGAYMGSIGNQTVDYRSYVMLTTEEGDILSVDLTGRKAEGGGNKDDDDEETSETREYIKWIANDHVRPSCGLHQSPFFPNIALSVADWEFHIWKMGEDRPLFSSPHANSAFTGGLWSPTRPAVLVIACADGSLMVWDFTDSSYRPSIELKATHTRITSMEFLVSSMSSRQQLLAVGDESGTLHIVEMPRNVMRPVHREESIMKKFINGELKRIEYMDKIAHDAAEEGRETETRESTVDLGLTMKRKGDGADDENKKDMREVSTRDEEEFAKLEAMFITELELVSAELPDYAKNLGVDSVSVEEVKVKVR